MIFKKKDTKQDEQIQHSLTKYIMVGHINKTNESSQNTTAKGQLKTKVNKL